jgi:hypothetical protein
LGDFVSAADAIAALGTVALIETHSNPLEKIESFLRTSKNEKANLTLQTMA